MIQYERRLQILQALKDSELLTLDQFQDILNGVSKSTIRRDLITLANEGEIVLLRGGAAKLKADSHETAYNSRQLINTEEKERVAKRAAMLVEEGETIYLDAGTTVTKMCRYLENKHINIVTTSASITKEMHSTLIKCIVVGGELLWNTESIVGPMTDMELSNMYFDKAFIGVSGFSSEAGYTTPDPREARKKQIVKAHSKKTYVLADGSKSGKITMCKIFDMADVTIICDRETPEITEAGNYIIA